MIDIYYKTMTIPLNIHVLIEVNGSHKKNGYMVDNPYVKVIFSRVVFIENL